MFVTQVKINTLNAEKWKMMRKVMIIRAKKNLDRKSCSLSPIEKLYLSTFFIITRAPYKSYINCSLVKMTEMNNKTGRDIIIIRFLQSVVYFFEVKHQRQARYKVFLSWPVLYLYIGCIYIYMKMVHQGGRNKKQLMNN